MTRVEPVTVGALVNTLQKLLQGNEVSLTTPIALSVDAEGNGVSLMVAYEVCALEGGARWLDFADDDSEDAVKHVVLWPL